MPNPNKSPAVQSVMNERKQQRAQARTSELDNALKDTFPASDPVSATHTAIPAGRVASETTENAKSSRHVDVFEDSHSFPNGAPPSKNGGRSETETPAIRTAELSPLEKRGVVSDIKDGIRKRPIVTIATAAAVGFVLATMRRDI